MLPTILQSFNNWIRDWKDLPVVELGDKIREMSMVLWNKRRLISEKLEGNILPAILTILKARTTGLGNLIIVKVGWPKVDIPFPVEAPLDKKRCWKIQKTKN